MGFWKGSGLSIVLDMIATLLSNGESTVAVTEDKTMNTVFLKCLSPLK